MQLEDEGAFLDLKLGSGFDKRKKYEKMSHSHTDHKLSSVMAWRNRIFLMIKQNKSQLFRVEALWFSLHIKI